MRRATQIVLGILIILSVAITCKSQTISVGYAVPLWGATTNSLSVSAGYRGFELYGIFILQPQTTFHNGERPSMKHGIGLAYTPVDLFNTIRCGAILFPKNWPSRTDKKLNFYLDVGRTFGDIRISYTHISNAYRGETNPGMDLIRIKYLL